MTLFDCAYTRLLPRSVQLVVCIIYLRTDIHNYPATVYAVVCCALTD